MARSVANVSNVQIVANLIGLVRKDTEADVFVSHCPSLGLYSQGETEDEAVEAIRSAVHLYLDAAYAHDRLDLVLRRGGFRPIEPGTPQPQPFDEYVAIGAQEAKQVEIKVPLTLVAAAQAGCQQ